MVKQLKLFAHILLIVGLLPCLLLGKSISVTARVDKKTVPVGTPFHYEVVLSAQDLSAVPEPSLPKLTGKFTISGTSESTSFSIINGAISASKTKRYTLIPLKPGTITIPPSTLFYNRKKLNTQSIQIKVTGKSASQKRSQQYKKSGGASGKAPGYAKGNVFIHASLNKPSVFVGEPVLYHLDLFRRVKLWSNIALELPEFKGFVFEDVPVTDEYRLETVSKKRYYAFDLTEKILFPVEPGKITIDPARIRFTINPFDGQNYVDSDPITLKVRPLPEKGRPNDFSGLVGDYSISSTTSSNHATQNAPFIVSIQLTGTGNVKSVTDLTFKTDSTLKIYRSKYEDIQHKESPIYGERHFEYIVVPKTAGKVKLPVFSIAYFSLKSKTYKTISTKPITLTVKESAEPMSTSDEKKIKLLQKDIFYLKTPVMLSKQHCYLSKNPIVLLLGFINVALLLFSIFLFLKQTFVKEDVLKRNRIKAYDTAIKTLKKIEPQLSTDADVVTKIQNAILLFFTNKTGTSFLKLTETEIPQLLKEHQLPEEDITRVTSLLNQMTYIGFSNTAVSAEDKKALYDNALLILADLKQWNN